MTWPGGSYITLKPFGNTTSQYHQEVKVFTFNKHGDSLSVCKEYYHGGVSSYMQSNSA